MLPNTLILIGIFKIKIVFIELTKYYILYYIILFTSYIQYKIFIYNKGKNKFEH